MSRLLAKIIEKGCCKIQQDDEDYSVNEQFSNIPFRPEEVDDSKNSDQKQYRQKQNEIQQEEPVEQKSSLQNTDGSNLIIKSNLQYSESTERNNTIKVSGSQTPQNQSSIQTAQTISKFFNITPNQQMWSFNKEQKNDDQSKFLINQQSINLAESCLENQLNLKSNPFESEMQIQLDKISKMENSFKKINISSIQPKLYQNDSKMFLSISSFSDAHSQEWSVYKSVDKTNNNKLCSSCQYCKKEIKQNYICLSCEHFYCRDCLKEDLMQQSSNCIRFQCQCSNVISVSQITKLMDNDRNVQMLIEKIFLNQLKQLHANIGQRYQIEQCNNKYCSFFCIIQQSKQHQYFFCPICLENKN